MITYSFPCQDLSLQGSQKGLHDGKASSMLWEVERILTDLKKLNRLPKYLVMENVKSLFSAKYRDGFDEWKKWLEKNEYKNFEFSLNSKYFGIPQNRDRAFMVSVHKGSDDSFKIPEENEITKLKLRDFMDEEYKVWNLPKGEVDSWKPQKRGNGIARTRINGYTTFQSEAMAFSKDSISPTITATGALNRIKVIEKKGTLRLLNSKEQWRLMGFDKEDWKNANELGVIPDGHLKKQAGNSIVVQVLQEIFKGIKHG